MKNQKRRGFTIVELVIVIAVIGILSAILIPTFIGLSSKANEASNVSFVKSLNTNLSMNEALPDSDPKKVKINTYTDVVDFSNDRGFDVRKLTPIDGNELLYDMEYNRFVIGKVNGDKIDVVFTSDARVTASAHNLWYICKDGSLLADAAPAAGILPIKKAAAPAAKPFIDQGCSVYLADNNYKGAVKIKSGFDSGENKSLTEVKYERNESDAHEVIVNLNSGTVSVKTTVDTVTLYGNHSTVYSDAGTGTVNIKSDSDAYVELTSGNVKFQNNAASNAVVIAEGVTDTNAFTVTSAEGSATATFYVPDDAPAAVKEAAAEMAGVEVAELKPADERQTAKTFAELEELIEKVNTDALDNPTIYLSSPTYKFEHHLEIKKSVELKGEKGLTTFLPYNAQVAPSSGLRAPEDYHIEAFYINTEGNEEQTISFDGFVVDHFGFYSDVDQKTRIPANWSYRATSFIRYKDACPATTVLNVEHVDCIGTDRNFINLMDTWQGVSSKKGLAGGTINLKNCKFDATDRVALSVDLINIYGNQSMSAMNLLLNIDDCEFIAAETIAEGYLSTGISDYGNARVVVNGSKFVNCDTALCCDMTQPGHPVSFPDEVYYGNCVFMNCEYEYCYWGLAAYRTPESIAGLIDDGDGWYCNEEETIWKYFG